MLVGQLGLMFGTPGPTRVAVPTFKRAVQLVGVSLLPTGLIVKSSQVKQMRKHLTSEGVPAL